MTNKYIRDAYYLYLSEKCKLKPQQGTTLRISDWLKYTLHMTQKFLDIYSREIKIYIYKKTHMNLHKPKTVSNPNVH